MFTNLMFITMQTWTGAYAVSYGLNVIYKCKDVLVSVFGSGWGTYSFNLSNMSC